MRFFLSRLLRKAFRMYQCLPSIFSSPAQHMKLYSITQRTAGKEQNLYLSMGACSAHSQTLCHPLSTQSLYKPLSSLHQGSFIHMGSMFLQYLQYIVVKALGRHQLFAFRSALPLLGPISGFENTDYLQIGRDQDSAQVQESKDHKTAFRDSGAPELSMPPLEKEAILPLF